MIILNSLFGLLLVVVGISFVVATGFLNADDSTPSPDGEGWGEAIQNLVSFSLLEGVASATVYLMSVLGPTAEVLSFAWPKESTQRKSHPDAALILRAKAFADGFRKGLPSPSENERPPCLSPIGLISAKASVLGAAYGTKPLAAMRFQEKIECQLL